MANAFATGRSPQHASVAFTAGILSLLDERELRGVVAHELAHVQNRDILVTTVAAVIATAISYIASFARWGVYASSYGSSSNERRSGINPLFAIIAIILVPFAATLLQLALSRSREYAADDTGAHTCQDPMALADGLAKLNNMVQKTPVNQNDVIAHGPTASLFIVHPFSTTSFVSQLFSTHPPVKERIARLRKIQEAIISKTYNRQ
jgi:heat shock protein HtpX